MSKNLSLVIILFLINFGNNYSQCNFINDFDKFLQVKIQTYEGESFLYEQIIVNDSSYTYFKNISENSKYIEYLLTNFSEIHTIKNVTENGDTSDFQNKYINKLKKDTIFTRVMCEFYSKSIAKSVPKDTINLNQLMNIAVKYFSIFDIDSNRYSVKVCTGINQISNTVVVRNPQLEAFCFSSIISEFIDPKINLMNEFSNAIQELYSISFGIDKNENLMRSQGALFILMKNNEVFKNYLINQYKEKAEYLPFVLELNEK